MWSIGSDFNHDFHVSFTPEEAAAQSSPAEDAQALLRPADRQAFGKEDTLPGQPSWDDAPGSTGIGVFANQYGPRRAIYGGIKWELPFTKPASAQTL